MKAVLNVFIAQQRVGGWMNGDTDVQITDDFHDVKGLEHGAIQRNAILILKRSLEVSCLFFCYKSLRA